MQKTDISKGQSLVDDLFKVGAHFGYAKSRRHPTVAPFIFGVKNRFEIIDLEKTQEQLSAVLAFVESLAKDGKTILFVSSKKEAVNAIREGAEKIGMPFVAGRWIGGTITNFGEIRKRVDQLLKLTDEREKGLLSRYTKKERLLIDRQIEKLEKQFGGLVALTKKPHAVFVIDSRHEDIAVDEAISAKVPVISLSGSDCDISKVDFPVVANDSLAKSISFFVQAIVDTYAKNKKV